jgi:uncharacterized protein YecE (DUF72 family)
MSKMESPSLLSARSLLPSLLIGTASWTDKTLLACGRFYPPSANDATSRLQYYADRFPVVEVDSSYYAIPSAATAQLWVERTPADFVFNMKAFRLFTGHQTPLSALDRDIRAEVDDGRRTTIFQDQCPRDVLTELWSRFTVALDPLRMAGKLGAVHFQYPPWVLADRRGMALVEACAARLDSVPLSVEFRHTSWFSPSQRQATLDLERAVGAIHTVVDAPQGMENTAPAIWDTIGGNASHETALVRLHGRNTSAWNRPDATSTSRFMYEYSPQELAELAEHIRKLAKKVSRTFVIFNTNHEDQGMRNAQALTAALALDQTII